ncbi:MAG: methylenetetrahydrofolate reductase C-terminal domain-containing protein [Acidobacteriota bacterium]
MIVAEQKPFEEIKAKLEKANRVLLVGCGTCVTVCFAGGEKEVGILASSLRMATKIDGNAKEIDEAMVQRQCEWEYLDTLKDKIDDYDLILSLGCGIGVQAIAEHFPKARVVPGLNTSFLGLPTEQGVWAERCAACGNCILDLTGGICPIARCSKSLLNGPCGGSDGGKCEVSSKERPVDCAWDMIVRKLMERGELERLLEINTAKNWQTSRDGGPRRIAREDLMLAKE